VKKNILTKSMFAALLLASTVVAAEEQYPATDFQPTVVYSDASASSGESSEAASSSETATVGTAEEKVEKAESSNTMLFGLVILAVAGGFFLSNKPKAKAKKASSAAPSYSGEASGLTGVEKYLQAQNASAATGVEKYLAKKEIADKEASLTGVDKYLRNRG
jgi:flagellar motor protein MotB